MGGNLGAAMTMIASSYLSQHGFANGWPSIFYATGSASIVWFIVWISYVRSRPEEHPFMTEHELNVIIMGTDIVPKKVTLEKSIKIDKNQQKLTKIDKNCPIVQLSRMFVHRGAKFSLRPQSGP